MNTEFTKGQYVWAIVWLISSLLFFDYSFKDWMKPWMIITSGVVQLASISYITYSLYKAKNPKSKICLIALCIDIVITVLVLLWEL